MMLQPAGYREREHTADWELEVWAPNLSGLLEQAARGMYWLAGARLNQSQHENRTLQITAIDAEGLLVSFLNELLYLGEMEGLAFDGYRITVEGHTLRAELEGAPLAGLDKEIKAVTYHNLSIHETQRGMETTIVFDV